MSLPLAISDTTNSVTLSINAMKKKTVENAIDTYLPYFFYFTYL
jgi:hypothetical protein